MAYDNKSEWPDKEEGIELLHLVLFIGKRLLWLALIIGLIALNWIILMKW